jgi:uncharacterized protein YjbI with pentapeptide repeats
MAGNNRRKQMANQEHLDLLKQGTAVWNKWRAQHPAIRPDLSRANLIKANLIKANLSLAYLIKANLREANLNEANLNEANLNEANLNEANLSFANLSRANLSFANLSFANLSGSDLGRASLHRANLSGSNLSGAILTDADLSGAILSDTDLSDAILSRASLHRANLSGADLSRTDLIEAFLSEANLNGANLSGADLSRATLVGTNLTEATLTECHIYGISAWDVELTGAIQNNLVITPQDQPTITVDNLKIAQFIYLLLNNEEIRDVIDTIAKKAVLILGRFTPERKAVLDALREALRRHEYLPILFDFEKPSSRNFTETVRTLAHLSRFIIADLTDPSSIPQELYAIVPTLAVPVQPLLEAPKREYSMFADFKRYHWVLPVHHYTNLPDLLATLEERVIDPAEHKAQELTRP